VGDVPDNNDPGEGDPLDPMAGGDEPEDDDEIDDDRDDDE
jgi:hypothetical protein